MNRDLRETVLYGEAEALWNGLRQPGTGQISDAAEIDASPDGRYAVFTGTLLESLDGLLPTRICRIDLGSGDTRVLTFGSNTDRLPRYSPDGRHVGFLSDRTKLGDFQLYLLDPVTGAARPTPPSEGWVEYFHWSPDGTRILLGVAGHGADMAGGQGAVTSDRGDQHMPAWMPKVETGDESYRWRRAWVYEVERAQVRPVSPPGLNIWEAVWCGNETFAAIASPGAAEGLWYSAHLLLIEVGRTEAGAAAPATPVIRELYIPKAQLGLPAASPSGDYLAVVEAVCSDRWIVAGELVLLETVSGAANRVDTKGVDVAYAWWRSDRDLLLAGHRGFETVVGLYSATTGTFTETWSSDNLSTGGRYVTVSGCIEPSDCVLIGESFVRAPEIAVIRQGQYHRLKSFDLGYADRAEVIQAVEQVSWPAPDGLQIQGWLVRPRGPAPHPVIMNIHGGPVWQWRPQWLGRGSTGMTLMMLLQHGYAIFLPNPRGSSGRGQEYARKVVGDMGGADTYDLLSGLDHMVAQGIADPERLGVMGGSYGGFMTGWLITQDTRFAAAVAVVPVANQVTEHLLSNIPQFVALFLNDRYTNASGKYFERSPIMHAHKATTPTLSICGALDRCTPPEEAAQFHNALLEEGVNSVLVTYPDEGHGVRKLPAAIDYSARVVAWFDEHMRAAGRTSSSSQATPASAP